MLFIFAKEIKNIVNVIIILSIQEIINPIKA